MAGDEIVNRLEMLEITVGGLTGLPGQVNRLDGRIESLDRQFLHFREEVGSEFSAIRKEAANEFAGVRREMATAFANLQEQMLKLHEEVMGQIAIVQVDGRETRAQFLALYESLRADIRSLRER